jgi:hypothetical protein
MLALQWRDHLSLICVCKQIYGEARESFFRRPFTCRSQDELIPFVRTRPKTLLQSITNIRLHLQEVEVEVMQPFLARISVGISTASDKHPYWVETNRITNALTRLPNIEDLSLLLPLDHAQSTPSSILLNGLLEWATARYITLHRLRIDFDSCQLASLAACRELQSLQLTGFSETNAEQAAEILSQLDLLESLTIIGPPRGLQMRQRYGHQSKIVQSINHRVLDRIRPLKRLVIKEAADATFGGVFLTSKTLKSIYDRHCESLRVLHVSSSLTPDAVFTTFLEALLMATPNIRELALTWPGMQVAFVDCVPASVQRLSLLVSSHPEAQIFVDRLQAIQYRLPFLRHIRFYVINGAHETKTSSSSSSSPPAPLPPSPLDNNSLGFLKGPSPLAFMLPIQHLTLYVLPPNSPPPLSRKKDNVD